MSTACVSLHAIHFATIPTPRGYVFRPDSRWQRLTALRAGEDAIPGPCLAFVVRHPEHGVLLVDTGLHPDAHRDLGADFGVPMRFLFRGLTPVGPPFDAQLRGLDIDPTDVRRVVMTHLHVDHTSAMRLLPAARFTCSRREWSAARSRGARAKGYVARHLPPADRMDLVDIDRDGRPHGPFSLTLDLYGDGSVRLVSTPGHTAGHMSILLRVAPHREVLLVGDAAYSLRNIDEVRLPLLTDDDARSTASLQELRSFRQAHPATWVIPSHDPDAWRKAPDGP